MASKAVTSWLSNSLNHNNMFFTDILGILWVDDIKYDLVLLCIDVAPNVVKCVKGIGILFLK